MKVFGWCSLCVTKFCRIPISRGEASFCLEFFKSTVKWGDIEQFSMFFLNKIDYHNHMAPILQT